MTNQAVYAIAATEALASQIVERLIESGFCTDDIAVLFPDSEATQDFSDEKDTLVPEGVATGAASGGVLGGTLGLLVGIGALAIPGIGPLIAAGPLLSTFSGAAAGATVGGIAGGLIGLGIPEGEAKSYESRIVDGDILISVIIDTSDEAYRATDVMKHAGAEDVSLTAKDDVEPRKSRNARWEGFYPWKPAMTYDNFRR